MKLRQPETAAHNEER